ncbi:GNAT family N-acetyltransferase [Mesorhizobium atlanticum]
MRLTPQRCLISNSPAGEAYRDIAELAWIADDDNQTVERYEQLISQDTSWVAIGHDGRPVAFLSAEILDDTLHVWESSLCVSIGSARGLGAPLLEDAIADANRRGLIALSLTTFRDVIWNAPFYQKLGFRILEDAEVGERLRGVLRCEVALGMPESRRCAMRLDLSQSKPSGR